MAVDGRFVLATINNKVMTLGFANDGVVDCIDQRSVALACSQWRSEIGCIVLTEAHIKCPRACQPYAIARFAEVVRHRRDEPYATAGFRASRVASRTSGVVGDSSQGPATL